MGYMVRPLWPSMSALRGAGTRGRRPARGMACAMPHSTERSAAGRGRMQRRQRDRWRRVGGREEKLG